jgi:hypothetical protein
LLEADDVQRDTGLHHERVRDADPAEYPGRFRSRNRDDEQREAERAGEPVLNRDGRASLEAARHDERQIGDDGERHRDRRKWSLVLERAAVKPATEAGVRHLLC